MAGYALLFFGALINWCAERLQMTTLSSCQAEYVAATNATTVAIFAARALLQFVDALPVERPTILLLCDNDRAVRLADGNTSSKRMKHIATRIAFLRETQKEGSISLHHVRTAEQLADICTKA